MPDAKEPPLSKGLLTFVFKPKDNADMLQEHANFDVSLKMHVLTALTLYCG
jgi:hypothetical protein